MFRKRMENNCKNESKNRSKAEPGLSGIGKKTVGSLLAAALLCGLSGCSVAVIPQKLFDVSTSYFNNYEAQGKGDLYLVSGTVHQAEDDNAVIVWTKTEKEQSIPVKGELSRRDGEIKLIYEAPDKTVTVLADSSQSAQDRIEFDTELKVGEGKGVFRFEGENAVFDFHVSFGGLTSGLNYLVSSDDEEDYDGDIGEEIEGNHDGETEDGADREEAKRLIDSYSGTFAADSKSQTVLKFNFAEKTKVKLDADLSADQESLGGMTLGRFQLYYVSENGKTVTVLEHNETDHALSGFHWESHYSEEIVFPEGVTEIILGSVSGENYRINLKIRVYEVE